MARPKTSTNPNVVARRILAAVNRATDPERGRVRLQALLEESFEEDVLGTLRLVKDFVPKEVFARLAGLGEGGEETEADIMRRLEKVVQQWQQVHERQAVGARRVLPVHHHLEVIDVVPPRSEEVVSALGFDPGEHVVVPEHPTTLDPDDPEGLEGGGEPGPRGKPSEPR